MKSAFLQQGVPKEDQILIESESMTHATKEILSILFITISE